MAIPDERLVLEASVTDDFTDTLATLSAGLYEIDRLAAETVEDINADVDIASAMDDLAALDAGIEAVEDDVDIDGDVSAGGVTETESDTVTRTINTDVDRSDLTSLFRDRTIDVDLNIRPALRELATLEASLASVDGDVDIDGEVSGGAGAAMASGGGVGAVGDGGAGSSPLSLSAIRRLREDFGDAFDPSLLLSEGQAFNAATLLEDNISGRVDGEEALDAIFDDTSPITLDTFARAQEQGHEGILAIQRLNREGLLDLPEDQSQDLLGPNGIKRAQQAFGEAFDPEALVSDTPVDAIDQLLEGGIEGQLDGDAVQEALLDDDNPLDQDTLQRALTQGGLRGVAQLDRAGVLDLPEESDTLFEQFRDLDLVMGDFYQVLASIIPLLGIFIGAIPAVVGGLLGLAGAAIAAAGALAGVAGLAVLGAAVDENGELQTEELTNRLEDFLEQALENLAPLANEFAPLVDTTLRSLNRTLARLAQRGDAIRSVTDDFTAALAFIEANAPGALARLVRFGEAAMPILGGIIREIGNMEIISSLATMLRQTMPLLATLTGFITRMLGPIFQLSRGFLVSATAITGFLSIVLQLLDAVPYLPPAIGLVTSILLGLVTATTLYTVATSGAIGTSLGLAASLLTSLVPGAAAAQSALVGLTGSATAASAAMTVLGGVLLLVGGIIAFFVLDQVTGLSEMFNDLTGDINEATDALKQFGNAHGRVGGTSIGSPSPSPSGGTTGGYQSSSDITVVAADRQEGNAIANSLGFNGVGSDTSENNNVANRVHNG